MRTRILEEVLLAPARQHQRGHPRSRDNLRIQAGQDRRLVAIWSADHDASPRTRLTYLDAVFRQVKTHALAVPAYFPTCELLVRQVHIATLVGDEVQPLLQQPREELPVVAAAVEDDREAPIADHLAYGGNHGRQALGQVAPYLLGHHQQGTAMQIIDEILHDAWQWHSPLRVPHLGHQPAAVVDLDVAVDVQVARVEQADLQQVPSQECDKQRRLALLAEII